MITEKPGWVRHGGLQIFSIDIQPGGLRFVTAGGDHKVRIWNMKYVSKDAELDQSAPFLLATLRDHFGSVNCVRWAKHGRYVASGSDDQLILIHERKPGTGTTEFGSGEPPDVENWKVMMTLRGHTADVVDLNWSPDDSILASCSLDNTVHIWNASNGICTAVLRGHSSLVKGVAWDPVGSFLASQSDDKTAIIWRTSDWSIEHRTEGHWGKSVGSTFFRRLGWSPCGHFITTTNGFQKPRHSAPVLERGDWSATFDFLGHNAPVVAVKFNHSMFRKTYANGSEPRVESMGWLNGSSKSTAREPASNSNPKELLPYNVIAIGSQDCTITVWTTSSPRPLFVAKHYFTQSVVDLSWSPDGYALFACSLDGTIATFHFEVKELGHKLTDAELDKLKRSRYGDVRGRQIKLAENPAQLLLEAASAEQSSAKKVTDVPDQNQLPVKPSMDIENSIVDQPNPKVSDAPAEDEKKSEIPSGVAIGGVSSSDGGLMRCSTGTSSPVKQTEYRRPDGRKRIIPEAVGVPVHQNNISGIAQRASLDLALSVSDQKRDDNGVHCVDAGIKEEAFKRPAGRSWTNDVAGGCCHKERSGVTARASITENLVLEKVLPTDTNDGKLNIEHAGLVRMSSSQISKGIISIRVFGKKNGDDSTALCLEAKPVERVINEVYGVGNAVVPKETEVTCSKEVATLWSDRLSGKVTVLAGNANFWAVGTEDGCLQVYTKCGRRAMPTLMVGSSAIFVDCDEGWKLLLVTKRGLFYVWDLFSRTCLVHDSLNALFTSRDDSCAKDPGSIKIISARFSRSGSPMVVLATRQAFLFDLSLCCWARIADDCFPASNFASSLNLGQVGELAGLQVDIGKFLTRKPGWNRTLTDDGVQTRAHLEAQLEASFVLKSPNEYRQCLLSYIRFLSREADESRLREICETFLGPPISMVADAASQSPAWDPFVLGMKKHKLLREDILPAMASSRKVQRLLNEFMDMLSEYETSAAETNTNQEEVPPPKTDT